eukprot:TRINITY_DN13996_c0_g1_i1.p1 TRINITY_DN13996_c0_g1~~TRINITY_DN13996_c0_g1_i1.p1  ORF type:complete len:514 (-),score=49.86 TRINITY_DN13996_c0_g1_i1:45-1523(-)
MLSQNIDPSTEGATNDLRRVYRNVVEEFQRTVVEKRGARYFSLLWEDLGPRGNIYRRNALYCEHRKHSEDLWEQMYEIADKHKSVLGGEDVSLEERVDNLLKALHGVRYTVRLDDEETIEVEGYLPVEEFVNDKVVRLGPFIFFSDHHMFWEEMKHRIISLNVFLLQIIAPFLILLNRWNQPSNHLRSVIHSHDLKSRLALKEVLCFGTTMDQVLTTILGTQLLFAVIFIVRCYADEQIQNISKCRRLPFDGMWFFLDSFANSWCICLLMVCLPLLFWSEETPTNIVLDSMTLIFLFKLDDLSEDLCNYVGMNDKDFQRFASWTVGFMSECPVSLDQLINPQAKSVQELWSVKHDASGNLLGIDGQPCRTRLQNVKVEPNENTPLSRVAFASGFQKRSDSRDARALRHHVVNKSAQCSSPSARDVNRGDDKYDLMYRINRNYEERLPTPYAEFSAMWWRAFGVCIRLSNFIIPIVWYLINQPCYPQEKSSMR